LYDFLIAMYLKQIELHGFKSFAEPTTISFVGGGAVRGKNVGTTAIVGPNGSGKSNVSDAIRWVMGEQSMKSLRGKKSDDVIFTGSDKKGKMSLARVALVLDNRDHVLPLEYDEVVIERKMYRNGDGEYRINGARVRLLDIVDTLAKAGIGKGSHCVVGQGMADAILNATVQERRLMIEDAAGVKHDQIRKGRAEKKLERTKENLTRTKELIAEVEPRLKLLKRQSEKAAKSKVVREELHNLQKTYFGFMWHQYTQERRAIEENIVAQQRRVKKQERLVDTLHERIATETATLQKAKAMPAHEQKKKDLYALLRTVEQEIATARGRIAVEEEKRTAEKRIKSIPVDLHYVRERLEDLQKKNEDIITRLTAIKDLAELPQIKKDFHTLGKELAELHDAAGKKTIALPSDANEEKLRQIEKVITQLQKDIARLEKQREQTQQKIAHIDQKITQEVRDDNVAREQFFVLEKELRGAQDTLDEARTALNDTKIVLARLEVHEEDIAQQAREDLHVEIDTVAYDGAKINVDETVARINALKREYERIGGIDPMVLDEYNETQERYDFLTTEVSDLERAIVKLKDVIKEMDKKIHSAFVQAYKEINQEFTKYFRILFGGGNAHLKKIKIDNSKKRTNNDALNQQADELQEQDDAPIKKNKADIGVEMIATPPGKKIAQLSLLSGGERSLTSIAMLFAIIAYNPPPFIVLDEVEAALDEANSRRLAKIFAELSEKTQFIIITHNRETMRHADMLYGVTMSNDGMSQILSVKLDQLDKAPSEK